MDEYWGWLISAGQTCDDAVPIGLCTGVRDAAKKYVHEVRAKDLAELCSDYGTTLSVGVSRGRNPIWYALRVSVLHEVRYVVEEATVGVE